MREDLERREPLGAARLRDTEEPERLLRVEKMVDRMEQERFGTCSNFRECEAVCPKEVSIDFIAWMNKDWSRAKRARRKDAPPAL